MAPSKNVRLRSLSASDLKQVAQFNADWQTASSCTSQTDRKLVSDSVAKLYELSPERHACPPKMFWCESPWQTVVMPFLLEVMLQSYDCAQLRKHLRSPLRFDLESQSDPLWKRVWQNLHAQLEALDEHDLGELSQHGLGDDLNLQFRENLEVLNKSLSEELSDYVSPALRAQLEQELATKSQRDEKQAQALKENLIHHLTSWTCNEIWGQWEFRVRNWAAPYFQNRYVKSVSKNPCMTFDGEFSIINPFSSLRQELTSNSLMRFELLKSVNELSWGQWRMQQFTPHAFARQHLAGVSWSQELHTQMDLWLQIAKESCCYSFFRNASFICAHPTQLSATSKNLDTAKDSTLIKFADTFSCKLDGLPENFSPKTAQVTGLKNRLGKNAEKDKKIKERNTSATLTKTAEKDLPKPADLKGWLDQYVIGQDEAKKVLAVAVYNHYKRVKHAGKDEKVGVTKSNVMLIGPSGSGKTLLVQSLAGLLSVPFASVDATSMTQPGYVGDDPEDMVKALYYAANKDVARTKRGIIYIDEIDKLQRNREQGLDVGGKGVQQSLLKMLEGTVVSFKGRDREAISVDTRDILFICGGAFTEIEKIIQTRLNSRGGGFGFGTQPAAAASHHLFNEILKEVSPDDLMKFGLIPEFVGRIPIIAVLEALDVDTLIRILSEPKDSLMKQYGELLQMEGVELELEPEAARTIAEEALRRQTGVRGLRAIVEKIMLNIMYELPSGKDKSKVVISKELVEQYCPGKR